jgi:type II secretory pathway component PulC
MNELLIKLLLLTLVAYITVSLFYARLEQKLQFVPRQREAAVALEKKAKQPSQTVAPVTASDDFGVIITRNIFQASPEAIAAEQEPEVEIEELEQTDLNLTLNGTITGGDQDARAIIVDGKTNQEDIYYLGDAVQGALIRKIERGQVVLEINGKREVLLIKEREGGGPTAPGLGAAASSPTPRAQGATPRTRVPVARPHRRVSFRQGATNASAEELESSEMLEPEVLLEEDEQQTEPGESDAGAPPPPEIETGQEE